jgi:S1-C subfamily serine protease
MPSLTATSNLIRTSTTSALPDIVDVVKVVRPAVVSIASEITLELFFQSIPQTGVGSGVIFDSRGYILTNNHVVEGARKITVTLPDGRTFDGTMVGRDSITDLAVVKITGENLPTARLGDSGKLQIGEWLIAIGNPLALEGGPTVTVGVVGAVGRSVQEENGVILEDVIQTDAAINRGNSGGPLVNLAGEVVGINTVVAAEAQNIGFAVSINTAKPVIESLIAQGKVIRPYMGANLQTVTAAIASQFGLSVTEGALLTQVTRNGPAAQAGLRAGDVITRFDRTPIATASQLQKAILQHKVGDKVQVTLMRDKEERTVTVTLAEKPM